MLQLSESHVPSLFLWSPGALGEQMNCEWQIHHPPAGVGWSPVGAFGPPVGQLWKAAAGWRGGGKVIGASFM